MNTTLVEGIHGHGALRAKKDVRDFKYRRLGFAPIPFDWTTGFDIEAKLGMALPTENQFSSFSCGGQALRYYLEALKCLNTKSFERLSAHDPYCQIFYPQGGTTIHDVGKIAVQVGIKNEATVPSYLNGDCTESFMEDKNLSQASPIASKFAEFGYAFPNTDIETIASAVRDNNGCILQVTGWNNGSWRGTYPSSIPGGISWSHFLYAGKLKLINGKRYVGVKNSWGEIGEAGWQWLDESFFLGSVTNAIVFFDKTLYQYPPTLLQKAPTFLQKFLNFFNNYFTN